MQHSLRTRAHAHGAGYVQLCTEGESAGESESKSLLLKEASSQVSLESI